MKKFITKIARDQAIDELMVSIRRNTQYSKCIDTFENLLHEIPDENVVDDAITDMSRFVGEFSRLSRNVDKIDCIDYISKMLTYNFIQPEKCFGNSRKNAKLYLALNDILRLRYNEYVFNGINDIVLSKKDCLGVIEHKKEFTTSEILDVTEYFGRISDLTNEDVRSKLELSRKVILLYNYMPAVVKAFLQTKRRSFNLDKNSKKFE